MDKNTLVKKKLDEALKIRLDKIEMRREEEEKLEKRLLKYKNGKRKKKFNHSSNIKFKLVAS